MLSPFSAHPDCGRLARRVSCSTEGFRMRSFCLFLCLASSVYTQTGALPKAPTDVKPGSITYDEIPYPYPVAYLPLTLYGQDVRLAYMDVPPAVAPNGRTV